MIGGLVAKPLTINHFSAKQTYASRSRLSEFFIERTIFWPLFIIKSGVDNVVNSIESNLNREIERLKEEQKNARLAEETFRKLGL